MSVRTPVFLLVLVSTVGVGFGAWAQNAAPRLLSPATFTGVEYPLGALTRNEDGRVVLNVTVMPTGYVSDASIATSSGSEQLDQASVRIAKGEWRFEPAMQNGQAVAATAEVEANWVLPLTPTQHAYFEVPNSGGATAAVPTGPYMARYADYPPAAAAGGAQGVVGVRYQVDANGNVTDAVLAVPDSNSRFNNAALQIARSRHFTPAMRSGMPVSIWQGLTVSFAVLPSTSTNRPPPCYTQPILAHDAVLIGTTPYRVEVSYLNAQYQTRWETRPVGEWLGIWAQVSDDGAPTEVLLYTDDGWMSPSQPIADLLTRNREYLTGHGGCWYYDAVSILG